MKQKYIDAHMKAAEVYADLSSARRLHVGCVVVKDNTIIGIGYNGMPSGWDNNCEDKEYMSGDAGGWLNPDEIEERWPNREQQLPKDQNLPWLRYKLTTKPEVIHAEANAIAKLAKGSESGNNSTMFLTHAPCLVCAKQIFTAGISKVYYRDSYRDDKGVVFLQQCGVEVDKYSK
mgnify:CR=1 FL=1